MKFLKAICLSIMILGIPVFFVKLAVITIPLIQSLPYGNEIGLISSTLLLAVIFYIIIPEDKKVKTK